MSSQYSTEHELGDNNVQVVGLDIHNPVFIISVLLILVFVIVTLIAPAETKVILEGAKNWSIDNFDWLFMSASNWFVIFCVAILLLPVGRMRLGGDDAKPDFNRMSWFAMLFAAGMGIGLMFWAVAEPIAYYTDWWGTPLNVAPGDADAAKAAMAATLFHWGFHPWAIYGVVGLALAYFTFNKGLPLTIRSAFYPLLGERVWGRTGDLIDVLAVLATIFGLATSLGLGAQQASSGLNFVFGIADNLTTQLCVIVGVTGIAVISVVRGLSNGVRILSNINMLLAVCLLVFVFIAGPTLVILSTMGSLR